MKPTLILPDKKISGQFQHTHDTFRELAVLWEQSGFVDLIYSRQHVHPYISVNGKTVCLFDRPRYQEWSQGINTEIVLFGNPTPPGKFKYESSWIFWARNPIKLEQQRAKGILSYDERLITSFFAGKIENLTQQANRTQSQVDWSKFIEDFSCPVNGERKYTQEQYLEKISQSKYGLCLAGYGNKCNREIELLGVGTVPIVTKGVDVTNYFEPLIEDQHYIYVDSGEQLLAKIANINQEQWEYMSRQGLAWYERNCSPEGSFKTTLAVIEKFEQTPQSFATLATDTALQDLELFYQSLRRVYPKHDIYLVCDDAVKLWATAKKDKFLHTNTSLQKYAGKNRKQMEADRTWTNFMLEKCTAIDDALNNHINTLFLDCDQCILDKIYVQQGDIGVSQHMIRENNEKQFGKYNGGFLFIANKEFTKWWRENTPRSKYMEQGILEEVPNHFSSFEFPIQYNYGWWRLYECDNPEERIAKFKYNARLEYDNQPVVTLHTHFFDDSFPITKQFNNFILSKMPEQDEIKKMITSIKNNDGLVLFMTFYNPKDPERKKEIDFCLHQNLNNPAVKKIVLFLDNKDVTYPQHDKIVVEFSKNEVTYQTIFKHAKQKYNNQVCMLINNDIFLDYASFSNLDEITNLCKNDKVVFSLSRHEFDPTNQTSKMDPEFGKMMYAHTQDGWIWYSEFELVDADFYLGTLGCDNAINERFVRVGRTPLNFGSKYKIHHYDTHRGKTSTNYMNQQFYAASRQKFPEEKGQFLTPDFGMVHNMSVDDLMKQLGYSSLDKYRVICDIFSKKVKIKNR